MSIVKASEYFTTGTGSGLRECGVYGIVSSDDIRTGGSSSYIISELIDKTKTAGESISQSSGDAFGKYSEQMSVGIYPGSFYLRDRRFYVFNEKISFVTKPDPILDDTENIIGYEIKLPDYPDGGYFSYPTNVDQPFAIGSPVVVYRFSSGELTGEGIPLDRMISSKHGLQGVNGYRLETVSGEVSGEIVVYERVIEGESETLPVIFSPLSQFTDLYVPWRADSTVVDPTTYYYDFEKNAIVFIDYSGSVNDEFLVCFERNNEPFIPPINLSPKVRIPRDGIVCISAENNDMQVYSISASVSQHTPGEPATIRAIVLSDRGAPIEGKLVSGELFSVFETESGSLPLSFTNIGETEYALFQTSGQPLYWSGIYIGGNIATVDSYGSGAIIRSPGAIIPYSELPGFISGEVPTSTVGVDETNDNGIASFCIIPSSIDVIHTIGVRVTSEGVTDEVTLKEYPPTSRRVRYGSDLKGESKLLLIPESDIYIDDTAVYIPIPREVFTPSDTSFAPVTEFLHNIMIISEADVNLYSFSHFAESGGVLYGVTDTTYVSGGVPVIVRYHDVAYAAIGNYSVRYESDAGRGN